MLKFWPLSVWARILNWECSGSRSSKNTWFYNDRCWVGNLVGSWWDSTYIVRIKYKAQLPLLYPFVLSSEPSVSSRCMILSFWPSKNTIDPSHSSFDLFLLPKPRSTSTSSHLLNHRFRFKKVVQFKRLCSIIFFSPVAEQAKIERTVYYTIKVRERKGNKELTHPPPFYLLYQSLSFLQSTDQYSSILIYSNTHWPLESSLSYPIASYYAPALTSRAKRAHSS